MGQIHNEIRRGPLSEALKAALGVSDVEAGLERFGETLTPILDLWSRIDWASLRGERHYARYVNTNTAPALRFASIELINPEESGVIVVVHQVRQASSPNYELGVDTDDAVLGANPVVQTVRPLDVRVRGSVGLLSPVAQLVAGDLAAGVTDPAWLSDSIGEGDHPPIVLPPNSKLFLIGIAAATDIQANIWWSERFALPGEV